MPKIIIFFALSVLHLNVTTAAAACTYALVACDEPDGQAKTHGKTLLPRHFELLPDSLRTTLSSAHVNQSLHTTNSTGPVLNGGRSGSLLDGRFAVSNPERAPIDFYGLKKRIDEDKLIGVFMRGKLPVADSLKFSGTVGFTRATFATGQGREFANDSDVSYGLGTEFRMSEDLSLSVDYMQLIDQPQVEHSGINLGLEGRF